MKDKTVSGRTSSRLMGLVAEGLFHTLAVCLTVVLVSLPLLDSFTLSVLWDAMHNGVLELSWGKIALQVGISLFVYSLGTFAYRSWKASKASGAKRVVRRARGAVMVETLIILVPFLLLTSGIAQLSLLNIGALLADVAVYQGARTAQIWSPEAELQRTGNPGDSWDIIIRERAKTASAVIMAPTAPNSFWIGAVEQDGSNDDFRRARAALLGSFGRAGVIDEGTRWTRSSSFGADGSFALDVEKDFVKHSTFSAAFDNGGAAWMRASRKMTAAYMCFDKQKYMIVNSGDRVGVEFEYLFPLLFPWFGYMFGEKHSKGCYGRGNDGTYGNYHVLRRNYTLPKYPEMN